MKVQALSIYSNKYLSKNKNVNFTSKPNDENNGSLFEVKNRIDALMNKNRSNTLSLISAYAVNQFKSDILLKLNNANKFDNIKNKVEILDQISDLHIRNGEFEKALAVTTQTLKEINNSGSLTKDEKKKLILSPEHWYTIRRYISSNFHYGNNYYGKPIDTKFEINFNQDLLLNLMKQIKITGYDEFMPLVEFINIHTHNNGSKKEKEINFTTREIINKYYDLSVLKDIKTQNYSDTTKVTILGEWGLPKHVSMIKKILDDTNYNSDNRECINAGINALGRIGSQESFEILKQYALSHSKKDVRNLAIKNITNCKIPESMNFIEELYNKACRKGNLDDYETLSLALSNFNNPKHAKLLGINLNSKNMKMVGYTLNALSNIKSPVTVDILINYLNTNPKPKSCGWLETNLYVYLLNAFATQELSSEKISEIKFIIDRNLLNASIDKYTRNLINELTENLGKTENTYERTRSLLNSFYPNKLILSDDLGSVPLLEDYTYINGHYGNLDTLKNELDQHPNLSLWNKDEKGYLTTIVGKIEDIEQNCQRNPNLLEHLGWGISISPLLINLYNNTSARDCANDLYLGNSEEVVDYYKKNHNTFYYHFYGLISQSVSGDEISLKALLRGIAQNKIELS